MSREYINLKESMSFSLGVAFTIPFLAEIIPINMVFIFFLPFLIIMSLHWKHYRYSNISFFALIFLTIGVVYTMAPFYGQSYFSAPYRPIIFFWMYAFLLITGFYYDLNREKIISGFFIIITLFAFCVSTLGLIKFYMQERGFLLEGILKQCVLYPGGSSFCGDYNLYGMMLLISIVGCTVPLFQNSRNLWRIFFLPIICSAGFLSGSRRFIFLAPTVGFILLYLYVDFRKFRNESMKSALLKGTMLFAVIIVSTMVIVDYVSDSIQSMKLYRGSSSYEVIDSFHSFFFNINRKQSADRDRLALKKSEDFNINRKQSADRGKKSEDFNINRKQSADRGRLVLKKSEDFNINRKQSADRDRLILKQPEDFQAPSLIYSNLLVKTVNSSTAFGLNSRLVRWKYAVELIRKNSLFWGSGNKYQSKFSCKFSECKIIDYPHMTILSAILFGGIGFGILLSFFYIFLIYMVMKMREFGTMSGITILVFIALSYSLISGDTLISIPQVIAIATLVGVLSVST